MRRYFYGFILASALTSVLACTTSETSTGTVTAPSEKCQVQVGTSATAFTSAGGNGMLSVATNRDCAWSAATTASWVTMASTSGQGEAAVAYTVAPNPVPSARAAAITVSNETVQLSQAAAPCTFALNHSSDSIGAAGGNLGVQITTLTGCAWTAATDVGWLTITSGQSGNASATIVVAVAANSGAARIGHVGAGNQLYTVAQSAAPTTPTPPPPLPPPPPPSPTPGQIVQVSGTMSGLSGSCPAVSFTVGTTSVVANSATLYTGRACKDIRNGRAVSVTGVVQANLSVLATLIDED